MCIRTSELTGGSDLSDARLLACESGKTKGEECAEIDFIDTISSLKRANVYSNFGENELYECARLRRVFIKLRQR